MFINNIDTETRQLVIDLAIEFADWLDENNWAKHEIFENEVNLTGYKGRMWKSFFANDEWFTTEQLFEQFIKERYGI